MCKTFVDGPDEAEKLREEYAAEMPTEQDARIMWECAYDAGVLDARNRRRELIRKRDEAMERYLIHHCSCPLGQPEYGDPCGEAVWCVVHGAGDDPRVGHELRRKLVIAEMREHKALDE